jgi:uncharacterized damage-inducible protein DinB
MDPSVVAHQFSIGTRVLERNLAGITHDDSLRSPAGSINSLNWILGHMVRTRNRAIALLGAAPPFPDEDFAVYDPEGFDAPRALLLDELKRRFDAIGPVLQDALRRVSAEQLAAPAPLSPTGNPNETVGTLLASLAFHEAYHLGQIGTSRRLLGKPGAIRAPGQGPSAKSA